MMKKICVSLCILLWLLTIPIVLADEGEKTNFTLNETEICGDMERSWETGYVPQVRDGTLYFCYPIETDCAVGYMTATMAVHGSWARSLQRDIFETEGYIENGQGLLTWYLPLRENYENGDYDVDIAVTGWDAQGQEITSTCSAVLRVRGGGENGQRLRPKLEVKHIEADSGSTATMELDITNPTDSQLMEFCELTVVDDAGTILMKGSNRMEIPSVHPGKTQTITIPMLTKTGSDSTIHSATLKLQYEALGQAQVWEEVFTFSFVPPPRISFGRLDVSQQIFQGSVGNIALPIVNLGTTEITNVSASLTVPGIAEEQTVLVGSVASGETKQVQLSFVPGTEVIGPKKGTIKISYEDPVGESYEDSVPVTFTVTEAPLQEEEAQTEGKIPGWVMPIMIVLCVLAVGGILSAVALVKKAHQLEEDKL